MPTRGDGSTAVATRVEEAPLGSTITRTLPTVALTQTRRRASVVLDSGVSWLVCLWQTRACLPWTPSSMALDGIRRVTASRELEVELIASLDYTGRA